MTHVLTTLGGCNLEDADGVLLRLPQRAVVMLAYLAEVGRPVARKDLAQLLWSSNPDAASTNLRSTLRRLADAFPPETPQLIEADNRHVRLVPGRLRTDLDFLNEPSSPEKLRLACDAVSRQFLPMEDPRQGPLAQWLSNVRARLLNALRSEFLQAGNSADNSSDFRRAGIMLLERDPHDEEVRRVLHPGSPVATLPLSPVSFATVAPLAPAPLIDLQAVSPTLPRIALLPPESAQMARRAGSVANALVEDLTIGLCESRSVSVVAPYTAERFRASNDLANMLEQHHVSYALDTRRSDDYLFVQLIFVPTDEIVWAARFELNATSVTKQRLLVAEAIQQSIVEQMSIRHQWHQRVEERPEAYHAYLRGVQSLSSLTLPAVRKARRQFREALDIDNGLALALAGISRTLTMEWLLTAQGDITLLHNAERLAEDAVQRDERAAGAFRELGVSQLYLGKIDESLVAHTEAERISPQFADAFFSHADSLVHASRPDDALAKITAAIEMNPISPDIYYWTAAGASYFLREHEQSLGYIQKMRNSRPAARLAAANWAMLGDAAKARQSRLRVLRDNPDFDLERWLAMIPHKEPWQTELYREGLVKAGF